MHILELHRQSGVSYTTLSNLYHEKTSRIDFNTIDAICRTLGVQIGELLEFVEETTSKQNTDSPKVDTRIEERGKAARKGK